MKIELEWPMCPDDGVEVLYTIKGSVTGGSEGCLGRHVGGHGDPDNCEAPYGPEIEIEEIIAPGGYVVHTAEEAAHGFTLDVQEEIKTAMIEKAGEEGP